MSAKKIFQNHKNIGLFLILLVSLLTQGCFWPSSLERKARKKPYQKTIAMRVTAYCSCGKCCNWKRKWFIWPVVASGANKGNKKSVGISADGTKAKKGTIAADTRYYPFGTIMYIPGYGWGEVHDIGSKIKGKHIDVFFDSHSDALDWGNQHLRVTIYK
ncbi:MAG: 3D domain-containing protein [Candidatus Aureabacteria bacterium]|nr:3D domain-containing protein [Candidatus Auribacterota bacterium]